MTRLQDDFYEYVNGKWAETAVIPDDKPSTAFCKTLSNTTKWWQILMHGKQLVWHQSCP